MAEDEEVANANLPQTPQPVSHFLEIICKSSGKVRRFSVGTEAGFALQLINSKLDSGVPLASYIVAVREEEEPICFGPNSILIDYGDGWKLQTVPNEASENQKGLVETYEQFPNAIEPTRDNVESATNMQLQVEEPVREEEKPMTSEPVSDIESQSLEKLDLTTTFTTDMIFNTRDELIKWTRDLGRTVGTVIVIRKSDIGSPGRVPRILFACERGGTYRVAKKGGVKQRNRKTGSKRCECPFALRGVKMPIDDQWIVKVDCGSHNHPLGRHSEGHSYAGKLTPEEKVLVVELSKTGVKPREVLNILRERDMHNAATISTIYNIRAQMRMARKFKKSECITA